MSKKVSVVEKVEKIIEIEDFDVRDVYTLHKLVTNEIEHQKELFEHYKSKNNYKCIFVEDYIERLNKLLTKIKYL